jgi:crotonobetainyl-CoA:carnitine CoA-transferase CaiB-like acyl-CoA transferase
MEALDDVRVLDLSRALTGPFCTMILGDLGADVIKVEEPGVGDDSRHWGPPFQGGESAYFLGINRNKRGITLNLKRPGGQELLWRLLDWADVLVENFRPGFLAGLGFDYEAVHARNSRIIYCSTSGFGQDGPEAHRSAYDIILQGMSGATYLTGDPDGSPVRSALPVCDVLSGMFAAQAILAALYARGRTGQGQRVETTLLGATVAALANYAGSYLMTGKSPERVGNQHPQIAPYGLLRTADGYFNVAAGNDDLWRRFCKVLELDDLRDNPRFATNADRARNRTALIAAIEARTTRMATAEVVERLERAGIPAGPIRDMAQVFASPQAQHISLARTIEHPTAGEIRVVNSPLVLSETPVSFRLPPPTLGQHTNEVLRALGYDDAAIAGWHADGTV